MVIIQHNVRHWSFLAIKRVCYEIGTVVGGFLYFATSLFGRNVCLVFSSVYLMTAMMSEADTGFPERRAWVMGMDISYLDIL